MKVYAHTKKGKEKEENQDRIVVGYNILASGTYSTFLDRGIVAVADGVGGNSGGVVASSYVANEFAKLIEINEASFININNQLLDLASKNVNISKMATTASGIYIDGNKISMFHIGNTRVYSVQGGYLRQLTVDDTLVEFLVRTGQLTHEEAETFERRNEINACFGGNSNLFDIKLSEFDISNISKLLITSDGVHEYISIDDIEDILASDRTGIEICETIVQKSLENDSDDDLSIVLIDCSE